MRKHIVVSYSASDAGFNTLRIWGGGIFLPDVFGDACDEKGIMLYHDMMFAQQGHSLQKTGLKDLNSSSGSTSESSCEYRDLGRITNVSCQTRAPHLCTPISFSHNRRGG